jgi:YetA-like protein
MKKFHWPRLVLGIVLVTLYACGGETNSSGSSSKSSISSSVINNSSKAPSSSNPSSSTSSKSSVSAVNISSPVSVSSVKSSVVPSSLSVSSAKSSVVPSSLSISSAKSSVVPSSLSVSSVKSSAPSSLSISSTKSSVALSASKSSASVNNSSRPSVAALANLNVKETAGVARMNEVIRSGIPIPVSANITDINSLRIIDAGGRVLPASFHVMSRWNPSQNNSAIQWLLAVFSMDLSANTTATLSLIKSTEFQPNAEQSLSVTQNASTYSINTGAATFVVGGNSEALFDEINVNNIKIAGGAGLTGQVRPTATSAATTTKHSTQQRIFIERQDPLSLVLVVEGAYDMSNIGDGGLASRRRYIFRAGSPVVEIRHSVAWQGTLCSTGSLSCNGAPNAVRVEKIRNAIPLSLGAGSTQTVSFISENNTAAATQTINLNATASLRQRLRANRTAVRSYEMNLGTLNTTGQKADGGVISVSGTNGTIAAALQTMHEFEPQALRLLADNSLAIDLVDDSVWLGAYQGLYSTMMVGAWSTTPTRQTLETSLWAPLNHPLRAWPDAQDFANSGAVDEFPVKTVLPTGLDNYDLLIRGILDKTIAQRDSNGLAGIMTFGLYPRYWGRASGSVEIAQSSPTASEAWDDVYWGTTWTDYHNTAATAPIFAMRTGEIEWLDSLATPAALRQLHTQIWQCAANKNLFYCGQSPSGYGGYRADFNSSHAYFDNLQLYYWLTGDKTVLEILTRGASSMRNYTCSKRPAAACTASDLPNDQYGGIVGRVAAQWQSVYKFLGFASDSSFHDDWKGNAARLVKQAFVRGSVNGAGDYGFLVEKSDPRTAVSPGTMSTGQLWMSSGYDFRQLGDLVRFNNDEPLSLGTTNMKPSEAVSAWARTLRDYGATTLGNGSWPNALNFTWSGNIHTAQVSSVTANTSGGDPVLYSTGKAMLTCEIARAADWSNDAGLRALALSLTTQTIQTMLSEGQVLSKEGGIYLSRLHCAVGRLSE